MIADAKTKVYGDADPSLTYQVSALPDWAQSLGMVMSLILLAPSWGGMINAGCGTTGVVLEGFWLPGGVAGVQVKISGFRDSSVGRANDC